MRIKLYWFELVEFFLGQQKNEIPILMTLMNKGL